MNRSRAALARTGLQSDGGRPSCPACGRLLQFGTDRQGRTTESCQCGYHGFVRKRPTDPEVQPAQ